MGLSVLLKNWERNSNSADMQPYVAHFISTLCNHLESWGYCSNPGEGETKLEWRLSQNHPANKKRGRTGTHIARGISVFRSDMLPRYREVKACIMKLRKIELKVVYLHTHL